MKSSSHKKKAQSSTKKSLPTLDQIDMEVNPSTISQVPVAVAQGPAPVDLESLVTQIKPLTAQKSHLKTAPDYALKQTLAARKFHSRSTSEVKKRLGIEKPVPDLLAECVQQSPLLTEGAANQDDELPIDVLEENKNLKNQIAQLQNVIVSMCVINQKQQSGCTSSTSQKNSRSGSRSNKASHTRNKNYHSNSTSEHRRSKTEANVAISNSVQKQIEPHPESLLIEPIERPALLDSMPPDWLLGDQNPPPKFVHTSSPQVQASGRDCDKLQVVEHKRRHNRRFSYQGNSSMMQSSGHNLSQMIDAGTDSLQTTSLQVNSSAIIASLRPQAEEDEVDLNTGDIDLRPDKLQCFANLSTLSLKSSAKARPQDTRSSHRRGRSQVQGGDGVPSFMRKTVSSQAKQVHKSTQSSSSNTSRPSEGAGKSQSLNQTQVIKFDKTKKLRSRGTSSSMTTSEKQNPYERQSQKNEAKEQSIELQDRQKTGKSGRYQSVQPERRVISPEGEGVDHLAAELATIGGDWQNHPLLNLSSSSSKPTAKIRSTSKKQKSSIPPARDSHNKQFQDLTSQSNTKAGVRPGGSQAQHASTRHSYKQPSRLAKKQNTTVKPGSRPGQGHQDRLLFQHTMAQIQSEQNLRKLKQEIKLKKQMEKANNSSMNKEDLAKVLHDATVTSLNSSQKLGKAKKHQTLGHGYEFSPETVQIHDKDYVEGAMPNTAKFDSAIKADQLNQGETTTLSPIAVPVPQKYKATLTDDEDSETGGEAEKMVLERMANHSPLKSGPSTVQGSAYESPMRLQQQVSQLESRDTVQKMTSSQKKVIVPPLNFDKVYEQQRLILEQEERRKKDEEKKLELQRQRELKASQSAQKKRIQSQNSHSKKKQTSQKKKLYTSSSKKFEESPQSKLSYNIAEDENKIVHIYGNGKKPQVTGFETIVKVDKKTEEKLMQASIDVSSNKKVQRINLKSNSKTRTAKTLDFTEEQIQSPPQAISAPKQPIDTSQTRLSKLKTPSTSETRPTKAPIKKLWQRAQPNHKAQTAKQTIQNQSEVRNTNESRTKQAQKPATSSTAFINHSKQAVAPAKRMQVFKLNKSASNNVASINTSTAAWSSTTTPKQRNKNQDVHRKSVKHQKATPQSRLSSCESGLGEMTYLSGKARNPSMQNVAAKVSLATSKSTSQSKLNVTSQSQSKVKKQVQNQRVLHEHKKVQKSLEITQNLLDSFSQARPTTQMRPNSRVKIQDLMQPILKQSRTRPVSIHNQSVNQSVDVIFTEMPRSCPFSPVGGQHTNQSQRRKYLLNHQPTVYSRSSNTSAQKNQTVSAQKTAFDNADICDIDHQLSLSVKVPVEAPSIVRRSLGLSTANSGQNLQSSSTAPRLSRLQIEKKQSEENNKSSAKTTINTPSVTTTSLTRQPSNGSRGDRSTPVVDTYSSLSKKRSGILQRQASAINHAEARGRMWKF